MRMRRYPHADAGRYVAPLFGGAGVIGGWLASVLMRGAPSPLLNAVLWAAISALTAFLVYASEAPRARPESWVQATAADGVVAGIIATVSSAFIDLILAAGAGTTSGAVVDVRSFIVTLLVSAGVGGVGGALIGLLAALLAGRELLQRDPPEIRTRRRARRRRRRR